MNRVLSLVIAVYALLAAVLWRDASWWLYENHGLLWCGNVVTDPFGILVRVVGPIAGLCALDLVGRCFKTRRWPMIAVGGMAAFVVTTAALACEAWVLECDYGFDGLRNAFWWLPRF
jgi:hypothetical protein